MVESERVDATTPEAILDVFRLPYRWAAESFQTEGRTLDVGGGEDRIGHALLGADDIDTDPGLDNTFTGSVLDLPFADRSYALVLCFETIEHVAKPLQALSELLRVTGSRLIVGSVNSDGPNFVRSGQRWEPIWKGSSNAFHLSEMGQVAFAQLFSGLDVSFYSSVETMFPDGLAIVRGLERHAVANYAMVRVR